MGEVQKKMGKSIGDIKWGEMVFVEAFPRDDVLAINEKLSNLFGVKASSAPIQVGENVGPDTLYSWQPTDSDVAYNAVLAVTEKPPLIWGGSLPLFHGLIKSIGAEALDTEELPFYLLTIRLVLSPKGMSESSQPEKDIRHVRNVVRFFIESLGGYSKKGVSFSPEVPAFTLLGIRIDQQLLSALQGEARDIAQSIRVRSREDVVEHRKLDSFSLNWDKKPDIWSHFILASNLSIILGHADQLGLLGIRTPYILFLSSDEELSNQFEQFRMPLVPLPMGAPMIVFWALPNMFAVPLALLAWSGAFWAELRGHERAISRISTDIFSAPDLQVNLERIYELTKVGIRLASLDVRIGMLERACGQTLDVWSKNSSPHQKELGMPSMPSWPSASRDDSQGGFLSYLGTWLRRDIDAMTRAIRGLERQVELLSGQANDAIVRKSTYEMDKATVATEKSQRSVTLMTYVLVVLTSTLVTIALVENGYFSYALLGAAVTIALAATEVVRELPRVKYLLVELVVGVVILGLWPSDWPWYWGALPVAAVVGFTLWHMFKGIFRSNWGNG